MGLNTLHLHFPYTGKMLTKRRLEFPAPIKLVPLSEYTTEHAPLLDKKRLKAAKNRSVDKSDTSSKWRALVHKHMNKHKYAFWLFTPRFRLIVMKNGPAKSTPTCKKDFEVSETLTEGKSAILGKTGFGFNLKQWLHFLKLCLIVLRAPSIQYFWRSMDETNDGPGEVVDAFAQN
ncbi:uncharacterized protein LOC123302391 isoform X4 [Chrysoperla carnea]|uniref:uncharacterized protein LOC123302391 isoform X4 n=2 Tax=Chrysoperla carnea TaxID=189513 RepID=UPI001D08DA12|nr:uncharacterized protein LOC123302391 isoform X4 [Chrysoperla carnea]